VVTPLATSKRPLVLFLGDAPTTLEESKNKPFYNAGRDTPGYWHNEVVTQLGYENNHLAMNMIQCVPKSRPTGEQINSCYTWLEKLFQVYVFKLVILYGEIPIRRMLGVSGSVKPFLGRFYLIEELGIKCFATLHPSSLINSDAYVKTMAKHIKLMRRFLKE